jgi:single-stranded-DNA-specific exonuclease
MSESTPRFEARVCNPALMRGPSTLHPVVRRVLAARGIQSLDETDYHLQRLLHPSAIRHLSDAAGLLADHLQIHSSILIFGDYDADGATSTALCLRALRAMGHERVSFLLPDRVVDGYGVSTGIARRIIELAPDLVITVDTGIASFGGLGKLHEAAIDVLVTDHHLPADKLPPASAIVNPNAFDDSAGKCLAGVGVAFYLMLALRQALRERNWFEGHDEPNLADLLDLVAVGTVADLVPLDYHNRVLVNEGLKRIRGGHCAQGLRALVEVSGRSLPRISAQDIGFSIGPRINAAGRLDDMSIGVQLLTCEDEVLARNLARELEGMNSYRRELQGQMTEQALAQLPDLKETAGRHSHVLFNADWHEGIVGIIASRIKDETYRPSIAFAPAADGLLKGSGRSIRGLHLRDMLDLVDKTDDSLIERFGGHAMAAGLSIRAGQLEAFTQAFEAVIKRHADVSVFDNRVEHDGMIEHAELTLELARALEQAGPWGQRFPAPSFVGEFRVMDQRVVGERHMKLVLAGVKGGQAVDGIYFYAPDEFLKRVHERLQLHYEMSVNEFRGETSLQLIVRHVL